MQSRNFSRVPREFETVEDHVSTCNKSTRAELVFLAESLVFWLSAF